MLKFLVMGNKLYLGATVPDKSIGGGGGFNYFDGFLMAVKDHSLPGFPKPVAEYLYSWWYPRDAQTVCPCAQAIDSAVSNPPIFKGRWAPDPVCDCATGQVVPRTAAQIAAWDARTVVNVGAQYRLPWRWGMLSAIILHLRVTNLFNEDYQETAGFPALGTQVLAGIRATFD